MSDLYGGWVLEHSRQPHNHGALADHTHAARCDNPLCGDRVTVQVKVVEHRIAAVRFQARSCAVATASASRMTNLVTGLSVDEATALASRAQASVDPDEPSPNAPLDFLEIVRAFRSRRRCATLGWQALTEALASPSSPSDP